jgi:hypothetical protein
LPTGLRHSAERKLCKGEIGGVLKKHPVFFRVNIEPDPPRTGDHTSRSGRNLLNSEVRFKSTNGIMPVTPRMKAEPWTLVLWVQSIPHDLMRVVGADSSEVASLLKGW